MATLQKGLFLCGTTLGVVTMVGCGSSDPCSGVKGACLSARVQGSVEALDQLRIWLDGQPAPMSSNPGGTFSLPVKLFIGLPAGTTGNIVVSVDGLRNGNVIASSGPKAIAVPMNGRTSYTFTLLTPNGDAGGVGDGGISDLAGVLSLSPLLAMWPSTPRGSTSSIVQMLTIANNLSTTGTLVSRSVVGANAADFAIQLASTCGNNLELPPGSSCNVFVSFTPTASGARSAQMQALFADGTMLVAELNGLSTAAWSMESIPSAVTRIQAIWGSSATDVYAVGVGSTVLHSSGNGVWTAFGDTSTNSLFGIWGMGSTEIYVAGNGGVWRSTGNMTWTQESNPSLSAAYAISGTSDGIVYVAGEDSTPAGRIFHRSTDGIWTTYVMGLPILRAVAVLPTAVSMFGDTGEYATMPTSTGIWSTASKFTTVQLTGAWPSPVGDEIFVSANGGVVWHLTAAGWKSEAVATNADYMTAVAGGPDGNGGVDVYAVTNTDSNKIYHSKADGAWTPMALPMVSPNYAVWVAPNGEVYVGGDTMFHYY